MPEHETNGRGHAEKALHHGKALREDAEALAGELRSAAGELQDKLDIAGRMERNPYATLAVAAGLGYVLGGGLFSRFTGQALRMGVKLMLVPLLKNELGALSDAAAQVAFSDEQ